MRSIANLRTRSVRRSRAPGNSIAGSGPRTGLSSRQGYFGDDVRPPSRRAAQSTGVRAYHTSGVRQHYGRDLMFMTDSAARSDGIEFARQMEMSTDFVMFAQTPSDDAGRQQFERYRQAHEELGWALNLGQGRATEEMRFLPGVRENLLKPHHVYVMDFMLPMVQAAVSRGGTVAFYLKFVDMHRHFLDALAIEMSSNESLADRLLKETWKMRREAQGLCLTVTSVELAALREIPVMKEIRALPFAADKSLLDRAEFEGMYEEAKELSRSPDNKAYFRETGVAFNPQALKAVADVQYLVHRTREPL